MSEARREGTKRMAQRWREEALKVSPRAAKKEMERRARKRQAKSIGKPFDEPAAHPGFRMLSGKELQRIASGGS